MAKTKRLKNNGLVVSHSVDFTTDEGKETLKITDTPMGRRLVVEGVSRIYDPYEGDGAMVVNVDRVKLYIKGDDVSATFHHHEQFAPLGGAVVKTGKVSPERQIEMLKKALEILVRRESDFKKSLFSTFRSEETDRRFISAIADAKQALRHPEQIRVLELPSKPANTIAGNLRSASKVFRKLADSTDPKRRPLLIGIDGAFVPDTRGMNKAKATVTIARHAFSGPSR